MENKTKCIKTNMGIMPLNDFLDIRAQSYGFDSYEELLLCGFTLDMTNFIGTLSDNE